MHSARELVTVGTVARDYSARVPSRPLLAAAIDRRQWLVSAALAVGTGVVTLGLVDRPYPLARGMPLLGAGPRLLIAFAVCSVLLLLRRWPLPVLAAVVVANALVMAQGNASLAFGIILGFASYLAASRLPRRVSIAAALASAAFLGAVLAYAAFEVRPGSIAAEAVVRVLPLAAGWFIGDSVAARRHYLAGLAEQAERERAAEAERARQHVREERVRIARELHDVVAHTLAVITVQAGVGRRLADKRPEEASSALESIETIGRTAQEELRVVLGLLRDEENRTAALAPAPGLVDVKELVETVRAAGTPVDLQLSGTDRPLSPALELSVYRVIQEALTNVVKHAPGARATVDLAVSDRQVRLDVTDDGCSAGDAEPASPGHGIVGMRERMGAFGGWLVAEPLGDRGFRVVAEVPIDGAA
jgi:signal transduction histidine kinase